MKKPLSRLSNPQIFLSGLYIVSAILLFLYSFTQIDLSLTFSRLASLKSIEMAFQYIGYFMRPLSTFLYTGLLLLFFLLYGILLKQWQTLKNWPHWKILFIVTGILMLSYNAFSYDLFNYMFDAKIVTHYHVNPYIHKALDFPGDPMLSFMRWTHRVYPYGPLWLVFTVPLSFLGLGFLLPTFYLFKLLMVGSFLLSVYMISRILRLVAPEKERLGVLFFAFNPLVLYECLVSAHNDIVMMSLSLVALFFLIKKQWIGMCVFLIASIAIKFATVFLLPVFLVVFLLMVKMRRVSWESVFGWCIVLMLGALIAATQRTNFQPWYLLYVLPFAALIPEKMMVRIPVFILSFVALLTYIPYIYTGNWDPPIPQILSYVYGGGVMLALLITGISFRLRKRRQ